MKSKTLSAITLSAFLSCTTITPTSTKKTDVINSKSQSRFYGWEEDLLNQHNILDVAKTFPESYCANAIVYFVKNNVSPEKSVRYIRSNDPIADHQYDIMCRVLRTSNQENLDPTLVEACEVTETGDVNEEDFFISEMYSITNEESNKGTKTRSPCMYKK